MGAHEPQLVFSDRFLTYERAAARAAALQALLVTGAGGLALLAGVVLLARVTGTYELSEMPRRVQDSRAHSLYVPILLLTFAAAFTKSAQFPFHFWLPRAMEAPTPVSAYLHAATMVKAGVYLLARMSPLLSGSALWSETLLWTGAGTAVLGAALAIHQRHFKRVLAYSTVGALGTMVLLIGVGSALAVQAMVVFLAAHALYKGALFLVAGAVGHAAHATDVERLGWLRVPLPATTAAAGLAALLMAGIPPLFGYISKELLFTASLASDHARALAACALASSALFFAVAVDIGIRPFWSREAGPAPPAREVAWPLWAAPLALALLGLLFGAWPGAPAGLLSAATRAVAPDAPFTELGLWHGPGTPLLLSAATFILGLLLYRGRWIIRRLAQPLGSLARFGPANGYALALSILNSVAGLQTRLLQRGYLRGYLVIILTATLILIGSTLIGRHGLPSLPAFGDLRFYEGLLAGLILVAALSAVRASARLASIISLGVVGDGVALISSSSAHPTWGSPSSWSRRSPSFS